MHRFYGEGKSKKNNPVKSELDNICNYLSQVVCSKDNESWEKTQKFAIEKISKLLQVKSLNLLDEDAKKKTTRDIFEKLFQQLLILNEYRESRGSYARLLKTRKFFEYFLPKENLPIDEAEIKGKILRLANLYMHVLWHDKKYDEVRSLCEKILPRLKTLNNPLKNASLEEKIFVLQYGLNACYVSDSTLDVQSQKLFILFSLGDYYIEAKTHKRSLTIYREMYNLLDKNFEIWRKLPDDIRNQIFTRFSIAAKSAKSHKRARAILNTAKMVGDNDCKNYTFSMTEDPVIKRALYYVYCNMCQSHQMGELRSFDRFEQGHKFTVISYPQDRITRKDLDIMKLELYFEEAISNGADHQYVKALKFSKDLINQNENMMPKFYDIVLKIILFWIGDTTINKDGTSLPQGAFNYFINILAKLSKQYVIQSYETIVMIARSCIIVDLSKKQVKLLCKHLLRLFPEDSKALTIIGDLYAKYSELVNQAILYYNQAIKYNEHNIYAILRKAVQFRGQKKYRKAIECYEKVIKLSIFDYDQLMKFTTYSEYSMVLYMEALELIKCDKKPEAIVLLQNAIGYMKKFITNDSLPGLKDLTILVQRNLPIAEILLAKLKKPTDVPACKRSLQK